jgi:hypothetical protein
VFHSGMRMLWVSVLAACGAPPQPVISNTAGPVVMGSVIGTVTDAKSGELLPGVTITVGEVDVQTAITDEKGAYKLAVPNGRHLMRIYYIDLTVERPIAVYGRAVVIDQQLDQGWHSKGRPVKCAGAAASSCRP